MKRGPRLMAIRSLEGSPAGPAEWAQRLARAGVDAVQIRDKEASDRRLFDSCRSIVAARRSGEAAGELSGPVAAPPMILVNRRPDIAVAAGADGVHLPASGLPIRAVRKSFGESLIIGRSTHSLEEVVSARSEGADYVVFGPVFATPEKLRFGPPRGLEELAGAARLGIPVLAIGGITPERLEAVARAGAAGVAAIRMFEDPARAAEAVERAAPLFGKIGAHAHV